MNIISTHLALHPLRPNPTLCLNNGGVLVVKVIMKDFSQLIITCIISLIFGLLYCVFYGLNHGDVLAIL